MSAAQCCDVVPDKAVLVDCPAAEPAPDAANHFGLVVHLDDQEGSDNSTTPAHLAELIGIRVAQDGGMAFMVRSRARENRAFLRHSIEKPPSCPLPIALLVRRTS